MQTPDKAREIIEDIQRSYCLHPEDLLFRETQPDSPEAKWQLNRIKRDKGYLEM
jgi:hypothetical protein